MALGATIVTNKRKLKPEEFFQGLFTTSLEPDEIITRVMFPLPKKAAYQKFRNQASRYALVGVLSRGVRLMSAWRLLVPVATACSARRSSRKR
jgi:CO/xanthine dehydrogenase FAD-binding subunit